MVMGKMGKEEEGESVMRVKEDLNEGLELAVMGGKCDGSEAVMYVVEFEEGVMVVLVMVVWVKILLGKW